jgi:hemoglobin
VTEATVYQRLGGSAGVAALLEGLYVRALQDPLFAAFFENIDIDRLKSHQHAFISMAIGGPQDYVGPSLVQAHAALRIEQRHFDAFVEHLHGALRDLRAPDDVTEQVLSQVRPLREVIVNTPSAASADTP